MSDAGNQRRDKAARFANTRGLPVVRFKSEFHRRVYALPGSLLETDRAEATGEQEE